MRLIMTLIYAVLLLTSAAFPATASVHTAMYCWVPDVEIAVGCDDDDDGGDGDDSVRQLGALELVAPPSILSDGER
jgi:hypothetical protein